MTSRTGLMPAVKPKGSERLMTASAREIKRPIIGKHSNKTQTHKFMSLSSSNGLGKTLNPQKPHKPASTELVSKISSNTAIVRKVTATNRELRGPLPAFSKPVLKWKSHPVLPLRAEKTVKTAATPARKRVVNDRRSPKSILKKELCTVGTGKEAIPTHDDTNCRHVKFKTKAVEQESLRSKLNAWLVAKGKTPSRCHHLMCFGAEMSAKRKRDKLVDRTITQNLLSEQDRTLQKEDVRKQLFTSVHPETSQRKVSADGKENVSRETLTLRPEIDDENLQAARHKDVGTVQVEESNVKHSPIPDVSSSNCNLIEEDIFTNLKTMLDECLTLFYAGCPLDNILPWLNEMETNIPKALSFAPYYICKAKVMGAFPEAVLEVFCEAIKNNAQPSELLAAEMKAIFSQWLKTPVMELTKAVGLHEPVHYLSLAEANDSYITDTGASTPPSCTSTPNQASNPKKQRLHSHGSTVKYSISSTTPIPRPLTDVPPLAVVTPVRRSVRLSNRQSNPGNILHREVNSLSDLGSTERKSMLFRANQALTGE